MFGTICDLDGTLYVNHALQSLFEQTYLEFFAMKLSVSVEKAKEIMAQDMREDGIFEMDVLGRHSISIFDWFNFCNSCINPFYFLSNDPILKDLLTILHQKSWIDVATNTSYSLSVQILDALGVLNQVDHIWCSDSPLVSNLAIYKPSKVLYHNILDYNQTTISRTAVIGDRYRVDLHDAEKMGIRHLYQVHSMDDTYIVLTNLAKMLG